MQAYSPNGTARGSIKLDGAHAAGYQFLQDVSSGIETSQVRSDQHGRVAPCRLVVQATARMRRQACSSFCCSFMIGCSVEQG